MSALFAQIILQGPEPVAVACALAGRHAYISTGQGPVIVLDEAFEYQECTELNRWGAALSLEFRCPALATMSHDNVLYVELYEAGVRTGQYWSEPIPGDPPVGGDAERFAAAFGANDVKAVERALQRLDYLSALDRHADLLAALGLPTVAAGASHFYMPEALLLAGAFVHV